MVSHSVSDESCGIISTAIFEATASFASHLQGDLVVRVFIRICDDLRLGPYFVPLVRFSQPHLNHLIKDEFCTSAISREGPDVRMDITSYDSLEAAIILLHYIVLGYLPSGFEETDDGGKRQVALARAWTLGYEYRLPEFRDMVMRTLIEILDFSTFTAGEISKVYTLSPRKSKLSRWLLLILIARIDERLSEYNELELFAGVEGFWKDWADAQEKEKNPLDSDWTDYMLSDAVADLERDG